jgi:uncharacterized repeat protein (TIGR01451 family)
MIPKRSPRALLGLWFTVALVLGAMTGPALTTAAVPSVYLTVVASPPEATRGALVGFTITVDNQGNSTSSQSSVDATIPNGTTYAGVYPGVYPSTTSCPAAAGHVVCTLGGIPGHTSVTFALAFQTTDSTPTPVSTTVTGQTTGTPGKDGGNSHGDDFIGSGLSFSIALVLSSNGDFSGRFVTGDLTVQDNQTVGPSNLQATKVTVPGVGIGVSVKDEAVPPNPPACTLAASVCDLLFGQNSQIYVAGNTSFVTAFPVTVTLSKLEIPRGINETNIAIYHTWTDATGFHEETISTRCTYDGLGNPTNAKCLTATTSSTGITVVVWLFHNGTFRTF